ncbi:MAG TPA: triose-phosphate isomerase, partial [Catalimonadaceae bacterium]|nr:triose-phosphate isomerase [Catalimonadaceae bacterium]
TGEIAADMLASADIPFVILGHSERRSLFGDSDEVIKAKVNLALESGLKPIFCCGEPLEVREAGEHEKLVKIQVEAALFHLTAEQISNVVIAYEPVWAIGTGKTATAEQAQEMHAFIRSLLSNQYGADLASEISILYGGSVKASNAAEIFSKPDVDGGLIGGAALQAEEFVNIVLCA